MQALCKDRLILEMDDGGENQGSRGDSTVKQVTRIVSEVKSKSSSTTRSEMK